MVGYSHQPFMETVRSNEAVAVLSQSQDMALSWWSFRSSKLRAAKSH